MKYEEFQKIYGNELKVNWRTGGMSGGNCWGGSADTPVSPENEPELPLDEIILKHKKDLSYMKYRQIEKSIVYRNYSEWEYYGNYYEYREKTLDTRVLHSILFLED